MMACTRSGPSASTAIAATSAESMPPDKPSTTPGKPFFVDVVVEAEDAGVIGGSRTLGELGNIAGFRSASPPASAPTPSRRALSRHAGSCTARLRSAFSTNEAPSKTNSSWPPT